MSGSHEGSGSGCPDVDHPALFRDLPTAYLVLRPDDDLTIADANTAYLTSVGRRREYIVGLPVFKAFPATPDSLDEDGVPRIRTSMEKARDSGRPDTMPVQEYDVPDEVNGGFMERHWSLIHVPVLGDDGRTRWLLQRAEDVTAYVRERAVRLEEREKGQFWRRKVEEVEADLFARAQELRRALEAKDVASRRLAGLADAALLLVAAETVDDLTASVISTGLRALGSDGGAVAVLDHEREQLSLTITGSLGAHVQHDYAFLPLDGPLPGSVAARTGEAVLLPTRAAGLAFTAEMAQVYAATGKQAWVALPLRAGGRVLGSLSASWAEERSFSAEEVELLAAFAAQCAQALDRLQVREAEQRSAARARRLSEALQRSLLSAPPEPDHLHIAVRYQPAAAEAQVGGDWYAAFLLQDGTTTLVVGDVTGHDRNAAAAMGQIRNVLRGIAQIVQDPPAAVLSALDRALHNLAVDALATAVLVQVKQDVEQAARGLREIRWSNAGHPPPLLLAPDGSASLLHRPPDLLLGLQADSPRTHHRLVLEPGHTLLLYTDGLVERRGESLDEGLERLRRAAETHAGLSAETCATRCSPSWAPTPTTTSRCWRCGCSTRPGPGRRRPARCGPPPSRCWRSHERRQGAVLRDEGADAPGPAGASDAGAPVSGPASLVLSPDPAEVRRARALVRRVCRDAGLPDSVIDDVVLLTSEAVTNAFTHGRSEARLCVVVTGCVARVEVGDDNSRHPARVRPDPAALDGRGMALVQSLAWRWGVLDDRFGKTVWFEVRD